ncbi:hypothetical protein COCC4DRAFT_29774 [Bipolaris maydis ATCC 48331]|uniref:Methyltransferase domain-containing protein n=2 Tax=Cochliobolus heterostrophus TaxID=5016 RepID=M2TTQ1_COCH5|nr:uncharacterized protein COCC4DRAFT_29774 [Bipolaris maydis ATCC 48331]EMD89889.1 hypothetical protein COCHEDRAFT_1022068 [Bipolaris maydis C5]KAH7563258.1 hypothetical protein BM1_00305 [Bipolaris maydis]ENI09898.1 hypothetical protein COCC4DRAFT_29774 [Bipolaris maydis ATCC 48331]KAJ5025419.1 hypothetical protein J3E73DRAFT_317530 [Bipolaris maydis]KAJ5064019.1 hypothetical protein J3E74DRAFT_309083 [Bipolaris maydis]
MAQSEETSSPMPVWYVPNATEDNVAPEIREVLVGYSGIPRDQVLNHVVKIRDEAWKVYPYPCIGQFRFVDRSFTKPSKEFDEIIQRVRNGEKLLDMGCCFGHTIRELVHAGAPAENIVGCDLQADFIELGYKLFQDRDKLAAKFITADIFDPDSALADYRGHFDIVHTGKFFHLWGYETQLVVSKAVFELLRPQPGSMIVGMQIGNLEAEERLSPTGTMFQHNPESFREMWEKIGKEFGVKLTVEARMTKLPEKHFRLSDHMRALWFTIRRE